LYIEVQEAVQEGSSYQNAAFFSTTSQFLQGDVIYRYQFLLVFETSSLSAGTQTNCITKTSRETPGTSLLERHHSC
jgi:hypothetical protein